MTQRGRAAGRPAASRTERGRPRADLGAPRARLRTVIEPVLTAAEYDLEDLAVSRAGRRHVVRVIVDADGGVSLDDIADISRAISAALDRAEEAGPEILAGEYQLEVSSPGVDRPLTLPRHWRRNVGRLVKVTAAGPGTTVDPSTAAAGVGTTGPAVAQERSGDRQITARVVAAEADRVAFDLDGTTRTWAYAELGPGRVQVEFQRLDDPADADALDDADVLDDDEDPYEIDDNEDVEGEER